MPHTSDSEDSRDSEKNWLTNTENVIPSKTCISDIRMLLEAPVEKTNEQTFILKITNCTNTQKHLIKFKIANYPTITENEVNTFRALLKMHYTGKAQMLNLLTDTLKVSSSPSFKIIYSVNFVLLPFTKN